MSPFFLTVTDDPTSRARTGELALCGGRILAQTPLFMPVGTSGSVKGVWIEHVNEMGYPIILGNTYHLSLRPGSEKSAT